jgi:hypothetical protein
MNVKTTYSVKVYDKAPELRIGISVLQSLIFSFRLRKQNSESVSVIAKSFISRYIFIRTFYWRHFQNVKLKAPPTVTLKFNFLEVSRLSRERISTLRTFWMLVHVLGRLVPTFWCNWLHSSSLRKIIYPEDGDSRISEILIPIYQTSWYHIPEKCNLNLIEHV